MPAVTADPLTLPRIAAATLGDVERPVRSSPPARTATRARASRSCAPSPASPSATSTRSSTWTRWARSTTRPGQPKGTDWHPHRGFETVTYIIDGTFQHQDSHGGGGVIENGATQWMTAGAGILHIETPPEALVISGGLFHGIQLWVNLPAKDKFSPPAYQNLTGEKSALLSSADGGALVRLIAGSVGEHTGPGSTHTPITLAHATIAPGARCRCPGAPTTTRWSTSSRAAAPSASKAGRSTRASSRCSAPVTG